MEPARPRIRSAAFVSHPPLQDTPWAEISPEWRGRGLCQGVFVTDPPPSANRRKRSSRAKRDLRRLPVFHPAANRRLISRAPSLGFSETKAPGEPWDNDFLKRARHPGGMANRTSKNRCAYAFTYCLHNENIDNHFQFKTRLESQYSVHKCPGLAHLAHTLSTRLFTKKQSFFKTNAVWISACQNGSSGQD